MTFVIDTGSAPRGFRDRLPDWFLDQQPDSATDAQLAFTYGQWIISEALRPRVAGCVIDKLPRKNERPSDHAPVIVELG